MSNIKFYVITHNWCFDRIEFWYDDCIFPTRRNANSIANKRNPIDHLLAFFLCWGFDSLQFDIVTFPFRCFSLSFACHCIFFLTENGLLHDFEVVEALKSVHLKPIHKGIFGWKSLLNCLINFKWTCFFSRPKYQIQSKFNLLISDFNCLITNAVEMLNADSMRFLLQYNWCVNLYTQIYWHLKIVYSHRLRIRYIQPLRNEWDTEIIETKWNRTEWDSSMYELLVLLFKCQFPNPNVKWSIFPATRQFIVVYIFNWPFYHSTTSSQFKWHALMSFVLCVIDTNSSQPTVQCIVTVVYVAYCATPDTQQTDSINCMRSPQYANVTYAIHSIKS